MLFFFKTSHIKMVEINVVQLMRILVDADMSQ